MISRRTILCLGGGFFAAQTLGRAKAETWQVEIVMRGRGGGSRVWFDPVGLLIQPGQTVRWVNRNPGNSHTTTAYNPQNFGRPLRMPKSARSWNSDFLLPDERFSVTFDIPGVYDFYCIPHEHAGMVGRIIVGKPADSEWLVSAEADGDLPEVARKAFPSVDAIMRDHMVRPG